MLGLLLLLLLLLLLWSLLAVVPSLTAGGALALLPFCGQGEDWGLERASARACCCCCCCCYPPFQDPSRALPHLGDRCRLFFLVGRWRRCFSSVGAPPLTGGPARSLARHEVQAPQEHLHVRFNVVQ